MWLFNKISFGMPYYYLYKYVKDINYLEFVLLFPIIFHMFWLGILPNSYLDVFSYSVFNILYDMV